MELVLHVPVARGDHVCEAMTPTVDFTRWYERTRPTVVRALLVTAGGDADAAEEAADEAMARAYQQWSRVQTMASPHGWAIRVGANVLRRRFRRRSTEARSLAWLQPTLPVASASADRSTELAVWEAVARLDHRSREVVALRYVAGLTEPEIATVLRRREGTVSSILSRARAELRRELEDRDD